jgi:iron complex outermembrane receptor protein
MFRPLKKASGLSLAFIVATGVGIGGTAVSAVAQDAAEDVIENIVITGSRIKRTDGASISPMTVLTSEDLSISGNLTLENFIQDLPSVTGGDYGAGVNNGNPGVASVSLRGLGPNRTLVLVNGKRFASQGVNGFVDLNSIPSAIVERIEVMRDGASTIYGTDAVAGVVNIITKKDFEGVEIEYGYDVTDEDDGDMHNFSATFGNTFEKGNFVLSAQVNKRDEIRQGDRGYSACPYFDDGTQKICGGSGTTTPAAFTPLGVDGILGSQVLDADGFTTRDFNPAGDAFNYAALSYLTTPQDVYSAYAAVNYQLIEESSFGSLGSSLEMNYSNRTSDQLLAPVGTFGGWITSASHPNNPFGDILCDSN